MTDKITACALLTTEGCYFHPGPPEGPEFEGLTRFSTIVEEVAGTGMFLAHPKVEQRIPLPTVFKLCREQFERDDINTIDFFIRDTEVGQWGLEGPVLTPGLTPGDADSMANPRPVRAEGYSNGFMRARKTSPSVVQSASGRFRRSPTFTTST